MGLMSRKKARKQEAAAQQSVEEALHERALRLVDTRGVMLRAAEAELQAAVAALRAYATPERERRVAEAKQRVAEAVEEARSSNRVA
jgi:hypothetical protein